MNHISEVIAAINFKLSLFELEILTGFYRELNVSIQLKLFSVLKLFLFVQIPVDSFDDDVVINGQNDDIGGLGKNVNLKDGLTWTISDHQTPKKKAKV